MAKRIVTKIGNVFLVKLENCQRYFQYVANDMTMLNSSVIRAFKEQYTLGSTPNLNEVVKGEIDFYAHTVLRWGIELDFWEKIGKEEVIGEVDILFRDSLDYGENTNTISERWQVWHINDPDFTYVGKLKGRNREAYVGCVIPPIDIYNRIKTGKYSYYYPCFE
jgi:hypothetical protein